MAKQLKEPLDRGENQGKGNGSGTTNSVSKTNFSKYILIGLGIAVLAIILLSIL